MQCSDGLSNKVSNIITGFIDNMKLLFICILILSHSFIFFRLFFSIKVYTVVFLFNFVIYVFLLLYLCILIVRLCIFIVMYDLPFVFCFIVSFCVLCVTVYCTTDTGCQPNCS